MERLTDGQLTKIALIGQTLEWNRDNSVIQRLGLRISDIISGLAYSYGYLHKFMEAQLDLLVAKGYLRKEFDGNSYRYNLTSKGKEIYDKL